MRHIHIRQVESKPEDDVKRLFVRCLDCDRLHDLTCDTAVDIDIPVRSDDFQQFAEFLVEHSGHRINAKAETARRGPL